MFSGCCNNLGSIAPPSAPATPPPSSVPLSSAPVVKALATGSRMQTTPWNYYITMPPQLSILTVGSAATSVSAPSNPAPLTSPVFVPQKPAPVPPPTPAPTVVIPLQPQESKSSAQTEPIKAAPITGASILSIDEYAETKKPIVETEIKAEPITTIAKTEKSDNKLLLALAGGIIILIASNYKGGIK